MQQIPIGVSDFPEIRTENYYFVDKSMLIADVVRGGAKVTLLPRPRRFGKTLNLSMLHTFFTMDEDHGDLFQDLAVAKHEDVMAHCGAYPTIFLTFKDLKFESYDQCYTALTGLLSSLFLEFEDQLEAAKPRGVEKQWVEDIFNGRAQDAIYQGSLALFSKLLHRATGRKVVILIDEYDMPIHVGFRHGYYQKIIGFMRNLLSGAYKDNKFLQKGVLTGIMRIAKESIFSGFNNSDVHTVLDNPYAQHFGFTWNEVDRILADTGQAERADQVKAWYNGYHVGDLTLFNPWSIMKMAAYPQSQLQAYWVNTSDNQLIRKLITEENAISNRELEILLSGNPVHKYLKTNVELSNLTTSSLWSMLTHSGYLTPRKTEMKDGIHYCELIIPNREVRAFFKETISEWSNEQTGKSSLNPVVEAILKDDMPRFSHYFTEAVVHALSYHDTAGNTPERVYHVFLLGMLVTLDEHYQIRSNRESGFGRYDIQLIPRDLGKTGYVFEFKQTESDPETAAQAALQQIRDNNYGADLRQAGVSAIRAVGVAMCGKQAAVETALL